MSPSPNLLGAQNMSSGGISSDSQESSLMNTMNILINDASLNPNCQQIPSSRVSVAHRPPQLQHRPQSATTTTYTTASTASILVILSILERTAVCHLDIRLSRKDMRPCGHTSW